MPRHIEHVSPMSFSSKNREKRVIPLFAILILHRIQVLQTTVHASKNCENYLIIN